jgi:plasmid stabilization system protein ParE
MRFSFHPLALDEVIRAADWYRGKGSPQSARNFTQQVEAIIALVRKHPGIGKPTIRQTRSIAFDTFPYWLVYRIEGETLRILAFAHQRRRPRYWAGRR